MRAATLAIVLVAYTAFAQTSGPGSLKEAIAAHSRGDLGRAAALYRQALATDPGLLQARVNLGAALAEMGKLDDAISVLGAAPAPGRNDPMLRRNLALAYYRKGDVAAALRELESLAPKDASDPQIASLLADCYIRAGAPAKAVDLTRRALATHPENTALLYQYGTALVRSGQGVEALEPLERAGKEGGSAEALLLAGATALDLGQFQRAHADIENAIGIDPSIPGAWTWAGLARDRVSDEEGAKVAFRKALEANGDDFEATFHLGAILYRERRMQEARPLLERACRLQPSSNLARYALALVRSASGETAGAVAELEQLVRTNPNWIEPHVKLASLYFRMKRQADGQREREIVDKLNADNKGQKLSIPWLE